MKRKVLTFMMISNWKKSFGLHILYKNISALQGLTVHLVNSGICQYIRMLNVPWTAVFNHPVRLLTLMAHDGTVTWSHANRKLFMWISRCRDAVPGCSPSSGRSSLRRRTLIFNRNAQYCYGAVQSIACTHYLAGYTNQHSCRLCIYIQLAQLLLREWPGNVNVAPAPQVRHRTVQRYHE